MAASSDNFDDFPVKLIDFTVLAKQSLQFVGLASIMMVPVNDVQPLNVYCITVTLLGILGQLLKRYNH